jgi:hypothetical protein
MCPTVSEINVSTNLNKSPNTEFHRNPPCGGRAVPCGRTDMNIYDLANVGNHEINGNIANHDKRRNADVLFLTASNESSDDSAWVCVSPVSDCNQTWIFSADRS